MSANYVNNLRSVLCSLIILLTAGTCAAGKDNPYIWSKGSPPPMPLELYSKPELGNTSLVWFKNLKPGYYTMRVKFATGKWRRDFIMRVDHREIAFHSGYFTHDGKARPPIYKFDFVITEPGRHRIEIDCLVDTYPASDRVLKLLAIAINRRPAPAPPDLFATTDPGQQYYHGWGWWSSRTFQRAKGWKMTWDYYKKKTIDEPFKWGANYVLLYPTKGLLQDEKWPKAVRYAHEHGFLTEEMTYHGAPTLTIEKRLEGLAGYLRRHFDRLKNPAIENLDNWHSESYGKGEGLPMGSKENFIKTDQLTWFYNPGSSIGDDKSEPGELNHYMQWLHEDFHGPSFGKVMMCAGGWAYCGYDDMDVMTLFPRNLTFKNKYNWVYRSYQGNTRPYSANMWGGSSWIDWIAKESDDFFRLHAYALREGTIPINSFNAWLGEDDFDLPEQRRQAVYALSMDPCRSALVYRLASTGRDSNLSWRRAMKKQAGHVVPFRPRDWAPCTTMRLHNGILAANNAAFSNRCQIIWDSENLGQFDLNARTVELSRSFFETRLSEKANPAAEHTFAAGSDKSQIWNVKLPVGSYEIQVSSEAAEPFRTEIFLMSQYLGSLVAGPQAASCALPCYVSDDNTHSLELRLVQGEKIPAVKARIVPTNYQVTEFAKIGVVDDSSKELAQKVSCIDKIDRQVVPKRFQYSLGDDSVCSFPSRLNAGSEGPRAIDIFFDAEMGSYLLTVRARSKKSDQMVTVSLNSHRFCGENYRIYDPNNLNAYYTFDYTKSNFDKDGNYKRWRNANDWLGRPGYKARIGEFTASTDWQTFQIPVVCGHRAGRRRHKIEFSIDEKGNDVEFDAIAIYYSPIQHNMALVGGHKAILEESFKIARGGKGVIENRKLWMMADEPTVWLESERTVTSGSVDVISTLDYSGYEKIAFDGKQQARSGPSSKIPKRISFSDDDALRPPMTVCIIDKGGLKKLQWSKGRIDFSESVSGKQGKMIVAATLRADIGKGFEKYLASEPESIKLTTKGRSFSNRDNFTKVHLVKVSNPIKGPYFVKEKGWWSVRGAQPLHKSEQAWDAYLRAYDSWVADRVKSPIPTMPMPPYGSDLIRLIIPAKSKSRLQPYGFIDGNVRPGWGSQKQMLIKDVKPEGCTVKVLSVSAYLYAPRVEFSKPFTDAKVNGKPWAYHDGKHVFLPQKRGDYKIEVVRGAKSHPTLHTTAASVESAVYKDNELTVKYELPEFVFKLPEGLNYNYYVAFDPNQTTIDAVTGGKLLRQGPYGAIVEAVTKKTTVRFKKGTGAL